MVGFNDYLTNPGRCNEEAKSFRHWATINSIGQMAVFATQYHFVLQVQFVLARCLVLSVQWVGVAIGMTTSLTTASLTSISTPSVTLTPLARSGSGGTSGLSAFWTSGSGSADSMWLCSNRSEMWSLSASEMSESSLQIRTFLHVVVILF